MDWLWELSELLRVDDARAVLEAVLIFGVGLLLQRFISRRLAAAQRRLTHLATLRPVISFSILLVFAIWALGVAGVDVTVLVGAAGILTVAAGFAAQTSASNLISGIFLMGERPFVVGDVVTVDGTTGEVLSIDLLSVRLRTFDNLLVRIPNETMLKSKVTNVTHFPIRRIDLQLGVSYATDVERFEATLIEVADAHPRCLEEPRPLILFLGYGDSALLFQFSFWAVRESFLEVKNEMLTEIKRALDAHGIEIPFPQRVVTVKSGPAGSEPG